MKSVDSNIVDRYLFLVISLVVVGGLIIACSPEKDLFAQANNKSSPIRTGNSSELIRYLKLKDYSKVKELASGANLNIRDENGYTVIQIAMREYNEDILVFLLQSGADPNQEIISGTHPLETALLREDGDKLAYLLLKNGADINTKIADRSILLDAIIKGKDELATFILNSGARINIENRLQRTELFYISGRRTELMKLLIEKGANPNHRDVEGTTPIFTAIQNNDINLVRALIEHGADVSAKDQEGWTPLKEALVYGCSDIVNLLQNNGAMMN